MIILGVYKASVKTKDGRSWYFSTYYESLSGERKKYKSKKFLTKKEAFESERQFLINFTNQIENKNMTFKELINAYLGFQKDKVKISTFQNYNKYLKSIKKLENIKLINFNITQFNQWKEEINNTTYSIKYKNNIYKFLKSLLNHAEKYYDFDFKKIKNKMTGFSNPNELKKEMLFFTYDEFQKFIKEETEIKYKVYFEMLYYCGLRKGEANALTWNDINLEKKEVFINKNITLKIKGEKYVITPPKTKSSIRTIPIPKILINDLKLLLDEQIKFINYSKDWFVFGGISPLKDTTVDMKKNKNCQKANLKQIRIHDFRHSCASLLINSGASIALVAKYLGHSNISTTLNTYTHMFKTEMEDITKIIENLKNST